MNEALVSVVVVTHNSSAFVCETLESVYNQDYNNLELIVSDDGSKDNTVVVVRDWIKHHEGRFSRCEIVTTPENTGIPANSNRGIKAANGEWIKLFAGDDLLTPNCISICINYIRSHPETNVLFTKMNAFKECNGEKIINAVPTILDNIEYANQFNQEDAQIQFRMLLKDGCFLAAPTQFFNGSFIKTHKYPEIYKYEEDYPMWLSLTESGYKLHYIPDITMLYRRSNSLTSRVNDYYSRAYMQTRSLLFWNMCYNYYKQEGFSKPYEEFRKLLLKYELCEAFTQNKRNLINTIKMKCINFIVNKFVRYEL